MRALSAHTGALGRRKSREHHGAPSPRRAFTLVEVLLALALTVVLSLAVYSAIDLYVTLSTAGRDTVERAQIARAILRKMERDIRAVVYESSSSAPARTSTSSQTSQSSSTSQTGSSTTQDSQQQVQTSDQLEMSISSGYGLFGDTQAIVLHVNRPSRESKFAQSRDVSSLGAVQTDLRSVSYFLAAPGNPGLPGIVGDRAASEATGDQSDTGTQGLARLEGDRLLTQFADQQLDLQSMADSTELLAREIRALQFRYYDGVDWYEGWDTSIAGKLPQAVEIVLGFEEPPQTMRERVRSNEEQRTFRLVVSLTTSEPYVPPLDY